MSRQYQSPSSVEVAERCQTLYALRYDLGLPNDEVSWEDIASGATLVASWGVAPKIGECTLGQKSQALGKAVHAVSESYYGRPSAGAADIDWSTLPAQIFASGLTYLPKREVLKKCLVEEEIGERSISGEKHVTRGFTWGGQVLAGKLDLLFRSKRELKRLHIPDLTGKGWCLVDLKSTSDVTKYVKTPEQLEQDFAAAFYAYWAMYLTTSTSMPCRWVYMETKKIRRAVAVDFAFTRESAAARLTQFSYAARKANAISISNAEMNPAACELYGGCYMHSALGGPCQCLRHIHSI